MPKKKKNSQQDPRQNSINNITNLADKTLEAINSYDWDFPLDENSDSEIIEFRDAIENFLANFKG
jgi:hypothetical protein